MKYNRRRYLSFDLGFADFRSMFELF
jgi:hypothetical protein